MIPGSGIEHRPHLCHHCVIPAPYRIILLKKHFTLTVPLSIQVYKWVMHQSIPAVPIPPPPPAPGQPRGISKCCPSQGWGICVPRVDPRAFDTWFRNRGVSCVFVMEAFIGQDVDYVAD